MYYGLRWRILREPWGQPPGSEKDEHEKEAEHISAHDTTGRLIGVGRFHCSCPAEGQVRYMAVLPEWRGRGVGSAILLRIEDLANRVGMKSVVLNAREEAVGFYRRLGYEVVGDSPTLFGEIRHFRMRSRL